MKRFLAYLGFHLCYFGVLHPRADGRLIQTCYGCGREREVRARLEVV